MNDSVDCVADADNFDEADVSSCIADPYPVLAVKDLRVRFPRRYGDVDVLDRVTLEIYAGECVAVVGESGCGKSLLGLSVADLLPRTAKRHGIISVGGLTLTELSGRERRDLHGSRIGIVYQDALSSLNPAMSISAQMRQVCRLEGFVTPQQLLEDVGLTDTARILAAKPYQISGGQRQRVLIALALARRPELVIADEPTTALDVTVQAQIIELLRNLQKRHNFALLFVSHDLALVSEFAARTVVMYAGQVVEAGPTNAVLSRPKHRYTAGLVAACRSLEEGWAPAPIPGHVRQPAEFASGCRFRDRCQHADTECMERAIVVEDERGHAFTCWNPVDYGN